MIIYNPITKFTEIESLSKDVQWFDTPCGTYCWIVNPAGGTKPRLYYKTFRVALPNGDTFECARDYLLRKRRLLAIEWLRRHMHFMVFDPPGSAPRDVPCWISCPLHKTPGRHCKTDQQTEWERMAADQCLAFIHALDRLDLIEIAGHPITSYSVNASLEDPSFTHEGVPTAMFELPSVPGPFEPPGDRIDTFLNFRERIYTFTPDVELYQELVEMRKIKPAVQPWSSTLTQKLGSWFRPLNGGK